MSQVVDHSAPRGWAAATLGDIVEPRGGKVDPQTAPALPFIGMEHVEAHTARLLGTVPAASMKSSGNSFKAGDVIYGRLRAYLNKVYQPDFDGLCSGEFIVLPESPGLSGRFLKYRLNAGDFVRFASSLNTGDRPRVDFEQLKPFSILLPPKSEQDRIADAIDELFSDLDAGVAALKRAQQKLALYRAVVLKVAVEGDLTADWRREHPNVEPASVLIGRLLAERRRLWEEEQVRRFEAARKTPPNNWRAKYREPAPPDTTKLPVLPAGWCWACIDQIGEIQGGLQKTPSRAPVNHHFPYLRVANVQRGSLDLAELETFEVTRDELDRLRLQRGDLLIVEGNGSRGEIGRCAMWRGEVHDCIHQNHIIRVRPVPGMLGEYLDLFMNSPIGQGRIQLVASSTSGLYTLSVSKIKQLVVPVPPSAEQELIVDTVEDQLSMVDHVQADVEGKVKTAQAQRQAILRQAFEGQLVRQDSRDEPASEILKRIGAAREERARQQAGTRRGGNCRGASPKAREAQFVGHR